MNNGELLIEITKSNISINFYDKSMDCKRGWTPQIRKISHFRGSDCCALFIEGIFSLLTTNYARNLILYAWYYRQRTILHFQYSIHTKIIIFFLCFFDVRKSSPAIDVFLDVTLYLCRGKLIWESPAKWQMIFWKPSSVLLYEVEKSISQHSQVRFSHLVEKRTN